MTAQLTRMRSLHLSVMGWFSFSTLVAGITTASILPNGNCLFSLLAGAMNTVVVEGGVYNNTPNRSHIFQQRGLSSKNELLNWSQLLSRSVSGNSSNNTAGSNSSSETLVHVPYCWYKRNSAGCDYFSAVRHQWIYIRSRQSFSSCVSRRYCYGGLC